MFNEELSLLLNALKKSLWYKKQSHYQEPPNGRIYWLYILKPHQTLQNEVMRSRYTFVRHLVGVGHDFC